MPHPLLSLVLCLAGAIAATAASALDENAGRHPRIGLVLAGGGAKGAAHIGVLQVLEEMRVPVDCIAGTSMGALVGATYASGMPASQIRQRVSEVDWQRTVGSRGLRDRMPIQRKLEGLNYLGMPELGLKDGGIRLAGGLLKSQEIENMLRQLVSDARFTRDFDDLPIPFRAVATDMLAGKLVVLESGDLATAMRASMALPGIFAPVEQDGMVLSDGGMMRNLPVDVARELCAEVVIAVWMTSPQPEAAELASALALAGRSIDVMIRANQDAQIATLSDGDVGIEVPMGDIGTGSFQRVPEAIVLGYQAADAMRAALAPYALPEEAYLAWRERLAQADTLRLPLAELRITGLDRVSPGYVAGQLQEVSAGASVTPGQINEATDRIFALGDFERVDYRLSGPRDGRALEIRPVEKSWGPNFLRFDLGLTSNYPSELQAVLRAEHERVWLNALGGSWRSAAQVGRQTMLSTDFYQPLDITQRLFVQPVAAYEDNLEDVYQDEERVARYFFREGYGGADLGANLGTRAQLRAGFRRGWLQADRDTGEPSLPELPRQDDASLVLRLAYDTRDAVALPTRGMFANLRYRRGGQWWGGDQDYSLIEGLLSKAFPVSDDSLTLTVGGGTELSGSLPVTQLFQLGGIRTFPGLRPGELRGASYWYASGSYSWKLADVLALLDQAFYGSLRLQAGHMGEPTDGLQRATLYGISGALSGRTPIGPITLSLGYVSNHRFELQFTLGRPIAEGSILDEIQ